jgi:hypothetical protein
VVFGGLKTTKAVREPLWWFIKPPKWLKGGLQTT